MSRLRAAGCVFAEDEARLLRAAANTREELESLVAARVAGRPLEHLLGWVEFDGLRIAIGDGVFVPRQRTQLLARAAAAALPAGGIFVELCCGSAAVAKAVIARAMPRETYAVDIDPVATRYAAENLGADGIALTGDLFAPLPGAIRGRVDVLAANAPYVPSAALDFMPVEARLHEPASALDGGVDGLVLHRRLVAGVREWLAPRGRVLVEVGREQAATLHAMMTSHGLLAEPVRDDDIDGCVVVGSLP